MEEFTPQEDFFIYIWLLVSYHKEMQHLFSTLKTCAKTLVFYCNGKYRGKNSGAKAPKLFCILPLQNIASYPRNFEDGQHINFQKVIFKKGLHLCLELKIVCLKNFIPEKEVCIPLVSKTPTPSKAK